MKLLFIAPLFSLATSLSGQKFRVDLNLFGQLHDYRSTFSHKLTKHWSENIFGTYEVSMSINYSFIDKEKYNFSGGLGLFRSMTTTYSAFDNKLVGRPPKPYGGVESITRYGKMGINTPFIFHYELRNNYLVGTELVGYLVFQRFFKNTRDLSSNAVDLKVKTFNLEQTDINILLGKTFKDFQFLISYRIIKIARVDKFIFFKEFFEKYKPEKESDIYKKRVDTYNPFKIGIIVRYHFFNNR